MKRQVDRLLQALVLIRVGQDLGHESQLARLVHDAIEMLLSAAKSFSG
jgi:hypothetical protein